MISTTSNISTSRLDVSDKVVIRTSSPTLYLKDTDNRSGMIHMNSNRMYFLSGGTNSESWSQVNGQWPLTLHTDSNRAQFGGSLDTAGSISSSGNMSISGYITAGSTITGILLRIGPMIGDKLFWRIGNHSDENLGFWQERYNYSLNQTQIILKGYIEDDGSGYDRMNFTGQHRCFIKDLPFSNTKEYEGRNVCADQNTYISMSNKMKKGNETITQNESLPYVSLCRKTNDKSCFGVISSSEDPNKRVDRYG